MKTTEKLQRFVDYISKKHTVEIKYDLDRINLILKKMGNPHHKIKGIHVAGTNGKGSTSAICEALAVSDKLTVGLYTSPHLVDYRERFRINGQLIPAEELICHYQRWKPLFEEENATFFEITTALAFSLFAAKQLTANIFEVGLGGKYDATNPFYPNVSVITSIGLDHTQILGDTIEQIAAEKAGIIKKGIPVVVGALSKSALSTIQNIAKERSAPLYSLGSDFMVELVDISKQGTKFNFVNNSDSIPLPHRIDGLKTNLLGQHQAHNSALALVAYSFYLSANKLAFNKQTARAALTQVNWPGRLQVINNNPLTILDCAHNEEGIDNLVNNLKLLYSNRPLHIVVSILKDKDFATMISKLCQVATHIYIAKNHSERAAELSDQIESVIKHNTPYTVIEDIKKAVEHAQNNCNKEDIVVVTGSIYTVSEIIPNDLFI